MRKEDEDEEERKRKRVERRDKEEEEERGRIMCESQIIRKREIYKREKNGIVVNAG